VIPQRLNFMCRRFGTLCSIFIDGVSGKNDRDETDGYLYRKRFGSKMPPYCWGFEITLRHTTLGRTPLDEWSASHRDLYLRTRNTRDIHPCPLPGYRPAVPKSDRPQTHALGRADIGIGKILQWLQVNLSIYECFWTRHYYYLYINYQLLCTDYYLFIKY